MTTYALEQDVSDPVLVRIRNGDVDVWVQDGDSEYRLTEIQDLWVLTRLRDGDIDQWDLSDRNEIVELRDALNGDDHDCLADLQATLDCELNGSGGR